MIIQKDTINSLFYLSISKTENCVVWHEWRHFWGVTFYISCLKYYGLDHDIYYDNLFTHDHGPNSYVEFQFGLELQNRIKSMVCVYDSLHVPVRVCERALYSTFLTYDIICKCRFYGVPTYSI